MGIDNAVTAELKSTKAGSSRLCVRIRLGMVVGGNVVRSVKESIVLMYVVRMSLDRSVLTSADPASKKEPTDDWVAEASAMGPRTLPSAVILEAKLVPMIIAVVFGMLLGNVKRSL